MHRSVGGSSGHMIPCCLGLVDSTDAGRSLGPVSESLSSRVDLREVEYRLLPDLGVPELLVLHCFGKYPVPREIGFEPVLGLGGRVQLAIVDGCPAPDSFELLAAHAHVCLIDQEPTLGAVLLDQGPDEFAVELVVEGTWCRGY